MTNKYLYTVLVIFLLLFAGCEDFLKEEPKSLLTAQYLETPAGVDAALNSAYSDLRYFYGGESALNVTCSGTDEWQRGPDGSTEFNLYTDGLPANGQVGTTWNWGYTAINTTNAVIKYAEASGMTSAEATQKMAEAKYLRATWYFIMVQIYGDCPLNLEFIEEPATTAERTSSVEVYNAIISDLEFAKNNLPPVGEQDGRVDAAAAYHLLAKVYLTRATHATASQQSDYQNAYDNAMELITNSGEYEIGLLDDFGDVHTPRNEHNREVLFTAERNGDPLYNDIDPDLNGNKNNRSSFFFRPHYQVCTDYGGLARTIEYGRPWIRVRPTNYLLEVVFADKTYDTRYNKTFQTVWLVNDAASLTNTSFTVGDTAIWLPGVENYSPGTNIMNIYPPSQYYDNELPDGTKQTVKIYPSMRKYDDIDRPSVNDASVRPFIIYKLSETYLIAAEAAMYLNLPGEAVDLLSVLRSRASYDANRSASENAFAKQQMLSEIPGMANLNEGINFILDERSRELCGEYMRFFDLARTRTVAGDVQLLYRVRNLTPDIPAKTAIQDYHVLYPIPQDQIDLTTNEFNQNPGY